MNAKNDYQPIDLAEKDIIPHLLASAEGTIDVAALVSFEMTEEDTTAYLQAKTSDVLYHISDSSISLLVSPSQAVSVTVHQVEKVPLTMNSVALLNIITPTLLQQTHDSPQLELYELLGYIKIGLLQVTIDHSELSEANRSQFSIFQETLQARGIDITKAMESLSVTLPELLSITDDELVLAEVAAILPDFLQQIERSPTSAAEIVNQTMEALLRKLEQPTSDEETARIQKEQQQAYEKSAQDAIISSLEVPPVPSLESLIQEIFK
jgi:hypothetical protein